MEAIKTEYYVIGLMSGTSLDGLDLAYCKFTINNSAIKYDVIHCETVDYNDEWKSNFIKLEHSDALSFCEWDRKTGKFFGENVSNFIVKYKIKKLDYVSSHGHTVFHQPEKGFTVQVGHGAALAAQCGFPVICDFRSKDVALGGQGAPLVPIGDKLLFSEYDYCLNLGGIANISFTKNKQMAAYDVVPVNIVLNSLSQKMGKEFDENGQLSKSGEVIENLLTELDQLDYYKKETAKSLGKEWVMDYIFPILDKYSTSSINDILATYTTHIANQISNVFAQNIHSKGKAKLLITGGGALNLYLVELITKALSEKCEVIIPDEKTLKFKEAIIFALLGLLRIIHQPNSLKSVTGASIDNIGGCVYL